MIERSEYSGDGLEFQDFQNHPSQTLAAWIEDARSEGQIEPTAMCLSTVGQENRPSARFVLLRGLDERGLTFFTNYESRKGQELEQNSNACATFWWAKLERQVRVEGTVVRVSVEESDEYFSGRPRESQLASAASPQSQPLDSREQLDQRIANLAEALVGKAVLRPDHWGGYRLRPDRFEFWQGRKARLHDRIVCKLAGGIWAMERLAP